MVVHGSASQMNKKILHIAELAAVVRKTAFILGNWPILLSVLVFNSTSVSALYTFVYYACHGRYSCPAKSITNLIMTDYSLKQ